MTRQINAAGLALIQGIETLRLSAFKPTPKDVPTIGWGHTKDVQMGDVCTKDQALAWLREDLAWAEEAVENTIEVDLTSNQFSALVSLAYNIGGPNFASSTLVKNLNAGYPVAAANQFLVWDKQAGVTLAGLDRRRQAEKALFQTPDGAVTIEV